MNKSKAGYGFNLFNFKLQHQIVLYFCIFFILPTIIVLVIMYNIYFNYYSNKVQVYTSQLINQVNTTIDSKLMIYNNITRQIYYNTDIINSLQKISPDPYKKMLIEKSVSDTILSLVNVDKYVLSAYILTAGMDIYYVGYGTPAPEENFSKIKELAARGDGRVVWTPTEKTQSVFNDLAFRALREIKSQDGRRAGTLVLIIKEEFFNDLYQNINFGYRSNNFIVTKNLMLVSSKDKKSIGKRMNQTYLKRVVNEGHGNFITSIEGKKSLVVFSSSSITGWTFVSVIPMKEILKDVYTIRNTIALIMLIFLFFLILLTFMLSRRITNPIKKLSDTMKIVQAGHFDVTIENSNNDEIGSLSRSFNTMIGKVNELIQALKEKEKAKAKAELYALQSQINPHFMYNTLNSIKFMAVLNNQDSIKNMVSSLIALLKNAAKNSDELIQIGQEMELIQNYIYIQSVRFGDFSVNYHIPEELKKHKIMKFTMQPVVENSILHGFGGKNIYGNIDIYVEANQEQIIIRVRDNGLGMDQETLSGLFSEKAANGYSEMGIKNINDRIKLNYGEKYGIHVRSEEGTGTEVLIHLPLIE